MSSSNFDQLSVLYSKIEKNRGGIYTPDFQGGYQGGYLPIPPPLRSPESGSMRQALKILFIALESMGLNINDPLHRLGVSCQPLWYTLYRLEVYGQPKWYHLYRLEVYGQPQWYPLYRLEVYGLAAGGRGGGVGGGGEGEIIYSSLSRKKDVL